MTRVDMTRTNYIRKIIRLKECADISKMRYDVERIREIEYRMRNKFETIYDLMALGSMEDLKRCTIDV